MNYMSKCTEPKTSSATSCDDDFSSANASTNIKCALSTASTVFPVGTPVGTTSVVASLNLDNTNLCNTSSLVEFETQLIGGAGLTAAALTLQIFKTLECNPTAAPIPVTPLWTFAATSPRTSIIRFFNCDQGDCANYYVVATVTTAIAGGSVTIANPRINIVSAANENCCNF